MNAQTAQRLAKGQSLGGCPTKYNPAIIAKAQHYLENYHEYGKNIPTLARLAQVLNISRDRLYVWSGQKDKKEFKYICDCLMQAQEIELIENGLDNTFNAGLTKLLLTKHDYTDNPQANQGNSGITVNVNRGGVTVQAGGQSVSVSTDQDDTGREPVTIDHE